MTTALVESIAGRLRERGEWLAVAESCTGGLISKTLTDLSGSSAWFERGYVTYSNAAKQALLGVPESLIAKEGAVSEAVVLAMAAGVLAHAPVQWAIAVTGIAGPTGGTPEKPVGTVWIAWAHGDVRHARCYRFDGDREAVRAQTMEAALIGLREALDGA